MAQGFESPATGQGLVDFALSVIGTPYFYGSKYKVLTEAFMTQMFKAYPSIVTSNYIAKARRKGNVGKINVDCSGLISAYTKVMLGSAQLYQQAYTRLKVSDYKNWANGVVVWRTGHVGVFFRTGDQYYVVEAKGIDYGTVRSKFDPNRWSAGLTFKWLNYNYTTNVADNATWRSTNHYTEPTGTLRRDSRGDGVRWIQYELVEAGYSIAIDGEFGPKTEEAVKAFQASSKITIDGIVGPATRNALKADSPKQVQDIPASAAHMQLNYKVGQTYTVTANALHVRTKPLLTGNEIVKGSILDIIAGGTKVTNQATMRVKDQIWMYIGLDKYSKEQWICADNGEVAYVS